jgi:hypothetical protein
LDIDAAEEGGSTTGLATQPTSNGVGNASLGSAEGKRTGVLRLGTFTAEKQKHGSITIIKRRANNGNIHFSIDNINITTIMAVIDDREDRSSILWNVEFQIEKLNHRLYNVCLLGVAM